MRPLSHRFFNTAGPCRPSRHYLLAPGRRLPQLRRLIEEEQYFVIHAARQMGKTTMMRALAEQLRAEGVVALHVSLEGSRMTPELAKAEPRWIAAIRGAAEVDLPEEQWPPKLASLDDETGARLTQQLRKWCVSVAPRPVVLLIDEVDTVEGEAMVSLLAQLRSGFNQRPNGFPSAIALVGMRDLKDYLIAAKGGLPPNPGSPFNIKSESLTLRSFTLAEVGELYAQHTAELGQPFLPEAVERAFYWSQGQPFLVNALAYHVTRREPVPLEEPITAAHIDVAKEVLILGRVTHLDNLAHRLYEPRVARILRPVLLGEQGSEIDEESDDRDYCIDLGLVRRGPEGLEPANPMYREVLVRSLTRAAEDVLPLPWWPWRRPEGGLDLPALIDAFALWWREHGDIFIGGTGAAWKEAAAHITFMAFLQRVVNGGGRISREYATGRGALDLLVEYEGVRHAIELKRLRPTRETLADVTKRGVAQLSRYLDQLGLDEGWLIIFDRREGRSWDEKLWREERVVAGRRLHLVGA